MSVDQRVGESKTKTIQLMRLNSVSMQMSCIPRERYIKPSTQPRISSAVLQCCTQRGRAKIAKTVGFSIRLILTLHSEMF